LRQENAGLAFRPDAGAVRVDGVFKGTGFDTVGLVRSGRVFCWVYEGRFSTPIVTGRAWADSGCLGEILDVMPAEHALYSGR
jgi:hypothetical protein